MTYDAIVFEAPAYHRNFGVRLGDIRGYASSREAETHTAKDDRAALRRLEDAGEVVQDGERWFLTPEGFKQDKGRARANPLFHHSPKLELGICRDYA